RLLVSLEQLRPAWEGQRFQGRQIGGGAGNPLVAFDPLLTFEVDADFLPVQVDQRLSSYRNLRFLVEPSDNKLVVRTRTGGQMCWSLPLPASLSGANLNDAILPCDHLALLLYKQDNLLAIDLIERRVRWSRSLNGPSRVSNPGTDGLGGLYIPQAD